MVYQALKISTKNSKNISNNSAHKKHSQNIQSPDGGFGWVVVISSLISHMLTDGLMYSYGVLAPEFIQYFGISRSTMGWLGSMLISLTLFTGPISSYLCDKLSYRKVAVAGSIISAIGFSTPYFYRQLWFLIMNSSIICGIGFGLVYLPSVVIVNVWFDKKRSLALGISLCGSGLGTFSISPLLELLILSYGWPTTMLIMGGILLLLIPCSLLYKTSHNNRVENNDKIFRNDTLIVEMKLLSKEITDRINEKNIEMLLNSETSNSETHDSVNMYQMKYSLLQLLKHPIFLTISMANFLTGLGFNSPYMFSKDRALVNGMSATYGSFLISSLGIGSCLGRIGFGYLATLKLVNRFHLHNISLIITGLILISTWDLKNYIILIISNLSFGIATGAFITLYPVLLVDIFGLVNLNTSFGLSLIFQGLSLLIGSPFAGWIYDVTSSYNFVFAISGSFITCSGIIMYLNCLFKDFKKIKFC